MLGVLINLSREQLLELVCIIIEELPWDLKTRRAIRNLLHHFHKSQMKCKLQLPLAPKPRPRAASASQCCNNKSSSVKRAEVHFPDPLWVLGGSAGPCDIEGILRVSEKGRNKCASTALDLLSCADHIG